jgi:hypothetical protein
MIEDLMRSMHELALQCYAPSDSEGSPGKLSKTILLHGQFVHIRHNEESDIGDNGLRNPKPNSLQPWLTPH